MIRSGAAVFAAIVALQSPVAIYSQSPSAAAKDAVTVAGAVKKPGLCSATTVLAALSQAGGLIEFIPSTVYVPRRREGCKA